MSHDRCSESAQYLLDRTTYRPKIGIICGTGLGTLGDVLEDTESVPYAAIPHFPISTGTNHKSQMLFGRLRGDGDGDDVEVLVMLGRFHLYEGYTIDQCSMPVRVMHLMGVRTLIATNAAGGLNPDYRVGDIMMLKDHINLMGFVGLTPFGGVEDERCSLTGLDRYWLLTCFVQVRAASLRQQPGVQPDSAHFLPERRRPSGTGRQSKGGSLHSDGWAAIRVRRRTEDAQDYWNRRSRYVRTGISIMQTRHL